MARNSKKVSAFLLFILFSVSVFHLSADAYRLSRNTVENGQLKPFSPFGATVQLSKYASRYQNDYNQTASPSPQPAQPQPLCPETMFTCNSSNTNAKNNDLFQQPKRQRKPFLCIDITRLCDGQADCPNGEDENELNCPTVVLEEGHSTESKSLPETAVAEEAGCYLCKQAPNDYQRPSCISMSLLCNGHTDCPLADDEHLELCSNNGHLNGKHHPQSIASGTSSFSTNQFSPTNITIVNSVPKDEPYFGDHQQQQHQSQQTGTSVPTTKDLPGNVATADLGSSKAGVHNGVGFMFRVDNLVIYNSQVKMFNQNSENIAPADEEARQNATGGRGDYQHQQHQQQQQFN